MAQANNGAVIQHVGEAFLTEVDVDEMTRDQLEIRAIRMILDSEDRRNLLAVSASFSEIADREEIGMIDSNLRVVPACINLLTGCTYLYLWSCELNRDDSIPDTLWQLTGLEVLSLFNNKLTSIPSQIGQLSSLTFLDLRDNNLVSLPDEIYQLTNLTKLFLHYNKLESISEEIGKLTNLTTLWISNNQLTKLPKSIGKLFNLGNNDGGLYILDNPLTSLPDSIRKVKHALHKNAFLDSISKKQHNLLLEDVETKAALRLQRRLVILLAKPAPPLDEDDEEAVEKHYNQAKYQVLQDPKLVKVICEYINHD